MNEIDVLIYPNIRRTCSGWPDPLLLTTVENQNVIYEQSHRRNSREMFFFVS